MKNRALRDQYYRLNVDLTTSVKNMIKDADEQALGNIFSGYMALLAKKDPGEEAIPVDPHVLQTMAAFAAQALSRQLMERYQ